MQELPFPSNQMEIILVDDGSSDATLEFVSTLFPEVICIRQDNLGVSAARNTGLDKAQGDWIALLDSDDEWLPNKLLAQFEMISNSELKICHTEENWIRNGVRVNQMNKHKKQGGWIFENCLALCVMSPSSILIHRSIFDQVGCFDESLPACEDYDLWLRMSARYEVAYVPQAYSNKYGGHKDQLSRQYWGMDRFRVIALEKCLTDPLVLDYLSVEMAARARNMLVEKLTILHDGALKHGNQTLHAECAAKLSNWGEMK